MSSFFELLLTASLTAHALTVPALVYLAYANKELRANIGVIAAALQGRAPAAGPEAEPDRIRRLQREVMDDLDAAAALADRNMDRAAERQRAPAAGPAARPDILAIQREVMDDLAVSAALADRNMDLSAERQRARSRSPTPAAGRPQRPGVRLSRSIARRASTVDMSSCRIARRLGGRHATLAAM